jgi:chemotaxis signal transduction protein
LSAANQVKGVQMTVEAPSRIALAARLDTGLHAIPLNRVYRVAGYATLTGQAEDYFAGWLMLHGESLPVFDLNRIVCEQATPERFGSRIVVVEAPANAPVRLIGLLAPGLTDTISLDDPEAGPAELLDVDSYLPMLYALIPPERA